MNPSRGLPRKTLRRTSQSGLCDLLFIRLNPQSLLGCPQDKPQHLTVRDTCDLSHLCEVSVPAPSRIGVHLEELRGTFGIKPPVKPGVIPALEPLIQLQAAFLDELLRLLGELSGDRLEAVPVR